MAASQPGLMVLQPMTVGGGKSLNGWRDNEESGQGGDIPLSAAFGCVFVLLWEVPIGNPHPPAAGACKGGGSTEVMVTLAATPPGTSCLCSIFNVFQ